MRTNNSGIAVWLTANEALQLLSDMGVGKRGAKTNKEEALDARQWLNWIGSGKVSFVMENGQRLFDEQHVEEVGKRYLESEGRAYSIYRYDRDSGKVIEFINSYQCSELWFVKDRQAQNMLASGKVPNSLKIGNEYYVGKQEAEQYQAVRQRPVSVELKHQGTHW